jgi:hypothetical protein
MLVNLRGIDQISLTECALGSTGRRNTLIEYLYYSTEVQCLSWPLVQLARSPIQICLRISGQVGGFREVLAEETGVRDQIASQASPGDSNQIDYRAG